MWWRGGRRGRNVTVRNVTRGSPKQTPEKQLHAHSFLLHLITMYVMNSWACSGPDSGELAGLCKGRLILSKGKASHLGNHHSPSQVWPPTHTQPSLSARVAGAALRRSLLPPSRHTWEGGEVYPRARQEERAVGLTHPPPPPPSLHLTASHSDACTGPCAGSVGRRGHVRRGRRRRLGAGGDACACPGTRIIGRLVWRHHHAGHCWCCSVACLALVDAAARCWPGGVGRNPRLQSANYGVYTH